MHVGQAANIHSLPGIHNEWFRNICEAVVVALSSDIDAVFADLANITARCRLIAQLCDKLYSFRCLRNDNCDGVFLNQMEVFCDFLKLDFAVVRHCHFEDTLFIKSVLVILIQALKILGCGFRQSYILGCNQTLCDVLFVVQVVFRGTTFALQSADLVLRTFKHNEFAGVTVSFAVTVDASCCLQHGIQTGEFSVSIREVQVYATFD